MDFKIHMTIICVDYLIVIGHDTKRVGERNSRALQIVKIDGFVGTVGQVMIILSNE